MNFPSKIKLGPTNHNPTFAVLQLSFNVAIVSYCKREIVPLQLVVSAAKSNVSRKMVLILEVLRTLTLPFLTDSLQSMSVSSINRMKLKHRCSSRQIFVGAKNFSPNFCKIARKRIQRK